MVKPARPLFDPERLLEAPHGALAYLFVPGETLLAARRCSRAMRDRLADAAPLWARVGWRHTLSWLYAIAPARAAAHLWAHHPYPDVEGDTSRGQHLFVRACQAGSAAKMEWVARTYGIGPQILRSRAALDAACTRETTEAAQWLCAAVYPRGSLRPEYMTLTLSAIVRRGYPHVLRWTIEHFYASADEVRWLWRATMDNIPPNNADMIKEMADLLNISPAETKYRDHRLLREIITHGHVYTLQWLVEYAYAQRDRELPLRLACASGSTAVVLALADQTVAASRALGWLPDYVAFESACAAGNLEVAVWFADSFLVLDPAAVAGPASEGHCALAAAARHDRGHIVAWLLERFPFGAKRVADARRAAVAARHGLTAQALGPAERVPRAMARRVAGGRRNAGRGRRRAPD